MRTVKLPRDLDHLSSPDKLQVSTMRSYLEGAESTLRIPGINRRFNTDVYYNNTQFLLLPKLSSANIKSVLGFQDGKRVARNTTAILQQPAVVSKFLNVNVA